MNSRIKNNQTEATSACDFLKKMLKKRPLPDAQFGVGNFHSAYTWEILELNRAKTACKLGMVVSPLSTERNRFFTTREEYPKELKQANRQAKESPAPRFGKTISE